MIGIYGAQCIAVQAQGQRGGHIFIKGIRILGILGRCQKQAFRLGIADVHLRIELY